MADEPRQPDSPQDPPTEPTEPLTHGDPLHAGPERRLTRTSGDRVIGGVAGGLGRYFGVDPILFRIAFVVLTFVGGAGLLAYIGLLAFVPSDAPDGAGQPSRTATIVGAAVLALAALVLLGPPLFLVGPVLLPIALVALVGVVVWRAFGGSAGGDPGRQAARVALVVLIAFAAAGGFVAVAVAAALGGGVVIAILTIVTGLALVLTAFVGGARWLILPALVLALPLGIVAATGIDLDGGVGQRHYRPSSIAQLHSGYELGMGELVVDLRDVELPPGRTDVSVDLGLGHAVVYVPDGTCVTSDVQVGLGSAEVLDHTNDGVDVAFAEEGTPSPGTPEVHVKADLGAGQLDVRRGNELFVGPFSEEQRAACP